MDSGNQNSNFDSIFIDSKHKEKLTMSVDTIQYWFVDIPLSVYIALVSGYLAYKIAYSGISESHKIFDIMMISIIFSSVATLTIFLFNELKSVHKIFDIDSLRLISASILTLLTSLFWRKYGLIKWLRFLNIFHIDPSLEKESTWKSITQINYEFVQAEVTLKNGSVLSLVDRTILHDLLFAGLYLGSDGGIFLVVQREKLPDGTVKELRQVNDENWGTTFTYVPASEIIKVSFRLK